jgi:predicted AAA+ superfamily ATPase
MPEAIYKFTQTSSLADVKKIHDDIVDSYLESLVKFHSRINKQSLEQILKIIPSQVGTQVKYTHLDTDRRIEITKRNLQILEKALLVHLICSSNASGLPLGASVSSKIFKPLFLDIGLMQNICGFDPRECINSNDLTNLYRGALAEQFVGQELLAAGGSENIRLFYWSRAQKSSSAEVDYVIVRDGKMYPIEVKSGPSGRLKSMHLFLDEHPHAEKGIVLSSDIYEQQSVERLRFLPLYSRFVTPAFLNLNGV